MDILLENGDELNLIMPKLARPLYFFSHQAFWHFDKLILLVESSQYFCILICIFSPTKHYQSRREIYTALFSADQIREFGSSQSCAVVDLGTEFKNDPEAKLETEYENAQEVEPGTEFNTDPKVEQGPEFKNKKNIFIILTIKSWFEP